ncbi:MAG: MurR/RpiR family transcriptional regulator, partial [Lactobacillus crispatus]|nr:MurR/RpiR family transcriptional regulator [Lactobacillus crispatus]
VIYMRVRDIAQNAHVSNSSIMRFIHKVGFNSFPEFKAYLKNGTQDLNDIKFQFINKGNFPSDIISKLNIVADKIYQADNIITLGMGDSAFLAGYAARKMAALGYNAAPVTDPFYPLVTKLENTTNNIVICFSVSGKTTEMVEMTNRFVDNEDVTLISITGDDTSPIAKMSRYALTYHEKLIRHNGYDLSSQVPVMYLIEGIVKLLVDKENS